MQFIKLFLPTIIYAFLLDMIWLGFIAKKLYDTSIGGMLRKTGDNLTPNWLAAVLVYIAIACGIIFFVLPKANSNIAQALLWGAAFGAVTYGIYDFTNFSILEGWPLKITLIDFIWGMVLCSLTSVFAMWIQRWLNV